MHETEPAMYNVAVGEAIDIRVTPIGTGVFVAASLDGNTLPPLPGSSTAPHYRFVADGPVGAGHIMAMEFSFPQANEGSRYEVSITGDRGGSAGLRIKESDPIKDPFLTFTVAN